MFMVESFLISEAGRFTGFEARRIKSHNAQIFLFSFFIREFNLVNFPGRFFVGVFLKSKKYHPVHCITTGWLPIKKPLLIRKNISFNNKEYNYEMSFKKCAFTKNVHSIMANFISNFKINNDENRKNQSH